MSRAPWSRYRPCIFSYETPTSHDLSKRSWDSRCRYTCNSGELVSIEWCPLLGSSRFQIQQQWSTRLPVGCWMGQYFTKIYRAKLRILGSVWPLGFRNQLFTSHSKGCRRVIYGLSAIEIHSSSLQSAKGMFFHRVRPDNNEGGYGCLGER